MFINYKKAINPKPLKSITHNREVIEYFNDRAPNGTRYIPSEADSLILTGDSNMQISGLNIVLSDEQKKILGKTPSIADIMEYIDNAQEAVDLQPTKSGFIIINGEEISIDKIKLSPFSDVKYQHGKFKIIPKPIQPFEIILSANGISKKLKMQRVAVKSISERQFETIDNEVLKISYITSAKTMDFEFSYVYNLHLEKSAKTIYETYKLLSGIFIGEGKLGVVNLKQPECSQEEKEHIYSITEAWRKISFIEEKVGKKLTPRKHGIVNIPTGLIEMLYQSLINKQPIKRNFDIKSINVTKKENDFEALNKFKGGLYFFSFNDNEEFSILGRKLVLPRLVYASNTIITDIQDNGEVYKICFKKDTSTFYGVVYFASENERRDYLKNLKPQTIIENSKSMDEFIACN